MTTKHREAGDPLVEEPTQLSEGAEGFTLTGWSGDVRPALERVRVTALRATDAAPRRTEPMAFGERYTRGELLGRGGMGEVYLCRDGLLGREVAMKIIAGAPLAKQAQLRQRFTREMRVQGQLEHPAVVPIYDAGVTDDGAQFFTMKCVRGESLSVSLRRMAEQPAVRARLRRRLLSSFSNLCMAMHYAHEKGVAHRDLKPDNVMLGQFGEVYVLDWGLAALLGELTDTADEAREEAPHPMHSMTEQHGTVGTPGYMAPELLESRRPPGVASDVYALGAILFYVLTGEALHPGRGRTERIASTRSLERGDPLLRAPDADIPPELADLCARATHREPGERPATAAELSGVIEAFLDGDRDRERRHEQATVHSARAAEALARSLKQPEDELSERTDSLREVGRALGLEPGHSGALGTLRQLLETPPQTMPSEAQRVIDQRTCESLRKRARLASLHFASLIIHLPIMLWMGVREWGLFALGWLLTTALFALTLYYSRTFEGTRVPLPHVVLSIAAVTVNSFAFGPFVGVPIMALGIALMHAADLGSSRAVIFGSAGLCFALPCALQALGIGPQQYVFAADSWRILPGVFDIHPVATPLFLYLAITGALVPGCAIAVEVQQDRALVEKRLALHGWQLEQLLPRNSPQSA